MLPGLLRHGQSIGSVPDDHGRSPVGHGRFMMSVPDVSPQFQSWVRHLRHDGMPLEYLWAGSPCRRPVRRPFRHAGMPLRYLWTGEPCRRTARRPPSPREDATEVPVGKVAVPKGAHSTIHRPVRHRFGAGLPRGDGSEAPMGKVAVSKDGQKTPFVTRRCL